MKHAACFALALAWCSLPALAQTAPVDKPDLKVGNTWTVRTTDRWKNQETRRVENRITAVNGDHVELDAKTLAAETGGTAGPIERRRADRATWTFLSRNTTEGKYVTFAFPLEVGKTWEYETTVNTQNGDIVHRKISAKVEGWEEVTVPAGTFRALKVAHSGNYDRTTPTEATSQRRSRSGTITETFWYVPEVKWWVKHEFKDTVWGTRSWTDNLDELMFFDVK